jgi:hypothetical protein
MKTRNVQCQSGTLWTKYMRWDRVLFLNDTGNSMYTDLTETWAQVFQTKHIKFTPYIYLKN